MSLRTSSLVSVAVLSVDGVTSTGDNNNDLTCGDSYQISATEYTTSGDRFIGWAPMNTSGNYSPADVTIADPTTTIDLTEDVSLVALYEPITYSVTVQVNPGMETYGDVSVDNAQFANSVNVQALQGQTINLYNTAEEGHRFTSWVCSAPIRPPLRRYTSSTATTQPTVPSSLRLCMTTCLTR